MEKTLLCGEQTLIRQFIQNFKITASKVETEVQRETAVTSYQKLMEILSKYIGQIEEYF
jgi:hypothetical protein